MAAPNPPQAPRPVDEVSSPVIAVAAEPPVPPPARVHARTITLTLYDNKLPPSDIRQLEDAAFTALGKPFCQDLTKKFWALANKALNDLRWARKQLAFYELRKQQDAPLVGDRPTKITRAFVAHAIVAELEEAKKIVQEVNDCGLRLAKDLLVRRVQLMALCIKTATHNATFPALWAATLKATDNTLAPYADLAAHLTDDVAPQEPPAAQLAGRSHGNLVTGLRATAIMLAQSLETAIVERERLERINEEKIRKQKEEKDKLDMEALRDKRESVAAIASNAALAASVMATNQLRKENIELRAH